MQSRKIPAVQHEDSVQGGEAGRVLAERGYHDPGGIELQQLDPLVSMAGRIPLHDAVPGPEQEIALRREAQQKQGSRAGEDGLPEQAVLRIQLQHRDALRTLEVVSSQQGPSQSTRPQAC